MTYLIYPGHSGAYLERPDLDRVRDLVAAGGVALVVAQDADRITREPAHRAILDEELERFGTRLAALDDWGDDSHEGQLLRFMRGWVGKGERLKTRERTRRGLDRKVKEGKILRRPRPPYGFAYDDSGEALTVAEPAMAIIRRIFEWASAEGVSLGEIARRLNGEGTPAPSGGRWWRQTVRYLLLNDLYRPISREEVAGSGLVTPEVASALPEGRSFALWAWNQKKVIRWRERDEFGRIRKRVKNEPRPRERWSGVAVDITGAGLSRELADAARVQIAENAPRIPPSTRAKRFWLLSGGMARCEVCGNALSTHTLHQRGKIRAYYRCYTRYNAGLDACTNGRSTPAAALEQAVRDEVHALLRNPERAVRAYEEALRCRAEEGGDPEKEIAKIAARIREIEDERRGYQRLAARGSMDDDELDDALAELGAEKRQAEAALRRVKERADGARDLRRAIDTIWTRQAQIRAGLLRHLQPEHKRRVLTGAGVVAKVDRDGAVRVTGRLDFDIAELLPTDGPFEIDPEVSEPPAYRGVVTSYSSRPCTS